MNIIIYTKPKTQRLQYISDFIFSEILNFDVEITSDIDKYKNSEAIKINYSSETIDIKEIKILPNKILFDNDIFEDAEKRYCIKIPTYELSLNQKNILNFDFLGISFFLLSRYEEYINSDVDEHGRFKANNSWAFKNDKLQKPLIDIWAYQFCKLIGYNAESLKHRKFIYKPTIDVDIAYAHLAKGFVRNILAYGKQIKSLNGRDFLERINVNLKKYKDPYDTFSEIISICKKNKLQPLFFFLVGTFSKYDRNNSLKSERFKILLREVSENAEIGLHSSYASFLKCNKLAKEKKYISTVIEKNVIQSRQHFLKMQLPETYLQLIEIGITKDYTMGYADDIGFRASTCTPFAFFNLKDNTITNLKLYPFAFMDGVFLFKKKMLYSQTIQEIKELINIVKSVDGNFIALWHNQILSEKDEWKGWSPLFEEVIEFALAKNKELCSI